NAGGRAGLAAGKDPQGGGKNLGPIEQRTGLWLLKNGSGSTKRVSARKSTNVANAASTSCSVLALITSTCCPRARAAASTCLASDSAKELVGFTRKAMTIALGAARAAAPRALAVNR